MKPCVDLFQFEGSYDTQYLIVTTKVIAWSHIIVHIKMYLELLLSDPNIATLASLAKYYTNPKTRADSSGFDVFDVGAELVVRADGEERHVGRHCEGVVAGDARLFTKMF